MRADASRGASSSWRAVGLCTGGSWEASARMVLAPPMLGDAVVLGKGGSMHLTSVGRHVIRLPDVVELRRGLEGIRDHLLRGDPHWGDPLLEPSTVGGELFCLSPVGESRELRSEAAAAAATTTSDKPEVGRRAPPKILLWRRRRVFAAAGDAFTVAEKPWSLGLLAAFLRYSHVARLMSFGRTSLAPTG